MAFKNYLITSFRLAVVALRSSPLLRGILPNLFVYRVLSGIYPGKPYTFSYHLPIGLRAPGYGKAFLDRQPEDGGEGNKGVTIVCGY